MKKEKYKLSEPKALYTPENKICNSVELAAYLYGFFDYSAYQEQMVVGVFRTNLTPIRAKVLNIGEIHGVACDIPSLFRYVITTKGGNRFALAHNHPSLNPAPSTNDVELTKRVEKGASILGLDVIDHIIFGDNAASYISLRDQGLI